MDDSSEFSPLYSTAGASTPPPELIQGPMEFLSRSWSPSAFEISKALSPRITARCAAAAAILEEAAGVAEVEDAALVARNPFTFACSGTSQLVLERIMSQSQEASQLTPGRLSHSGGLLNGGSLSESPTFSPSDWDDVKYYRAIIPPKPSHRGESRTLGKWLKDRRERKKEEARAHNAQLHAAISIAGLAAAVSAIASATAAATSYEDDNAAHTNLAIASAATLVAAQCVETAESLGAERGHLASTVASAVRVRTPGDIAVLTNAAASARRGAATLKARVLKEMRNVAAVIPVEKGFVASRQYRRHHFEGEAGASSGEVMPQEKFLGICSQELIARGAEFLKRTRKGALHWKIVSVYIDRNGQVKLKTKSRHVAGAITMRKKHVVIEVCKDTAAWPGRHLLEGGEERRYFGLKTVEGRVIEFECRGQREYEMWTLGVCRLLSIVREKARPVS